MHVIKIQQYSRGIYVIFKLYAENNSVCVLCGKNMCFFTRAVNTSVDSVIYYIAYRNGYFLLNTVPVNRAV